MMSPKYLVGCAVAATMIAGLTSGTALAQTPKRGGTLTSGFESGDPPTLDCHAAAPTLAVVLYAAPHYSLLVRYDIHAFPKIEGDLAESWTTSPDGLTYTFKLRPNVKFHDGTPLTSVDVKASYDRIRNPPQGVVSTRKNDFVDIASIEAPDPQTVIFRLSQPNVAMFSNFASPFNCIFSARKLAEQPNYPVTTIMGSGPFTFVDYVKGQSWTVKRFDQYFRAGQPYLDGFTIVLLTPGGGCARAYAGSQIDMCAARTMSPQEVETTRVSRGDRSKYFSVPILVETLVTFNSARKPFDDVRVRRALSLAIDRRGQIEPLSKITNQLAWGTVTRPGSEFALPDADIAKAPGFGTDINAARAEARRLLAEAGQSNLKFTLLNRPINPNQQLGVWLVDQWRQIGVTVDVNLQDAGPATVLQTSGEFDAVFDTNPVSAEDPTALLAKFVPGNGANFGRYTDAALTDFYNKQRSQLNPAMRKQIVNDFERRLLDQAYVAPLFWPGWSAAVANYVHGWEPTPIFYVGWDMAGVWRD